MDVIFEPEGGEPFSIELGYFDTVLEIKEKIQKYQGIPIPKQTLVFNGQVLQDEHDIEQCVILNDSHIQLLVAPDSSPSEKIDLKIKMPSSKFYIFLALDGSDTVLHLKEKIHEAEPMFPVNNLVVKSSGAELQDHQSLRDCELMDNAEIDVTISPSHNASGSGLGSGSMGPPPPIPSRSGSGSMGPPPPVPSRSSKKLKLFVLAYRENIKIPAEVNPSDNVSELRKELQRLRQRHHFPLPKDGYFFIYKQDVMDDDISFRWHHVKEGDTIEVFPGTVTRGLP